MYRVANQRRLFLQRVFGGVSMWQVLIKLVEKWACRHEWEHWQEVNVTSDLGRYQIHHFVCKKCGKFKRVKSI